MQAGQLIQTLQSNDESGRYTSLNDNANQVNAPMLQSNHASPARYSYTPTKGQIRTMTFTNQLFMPDNSFKHSNRMMNQDAARHQIIMQARRDGAKLQPKDKSEQ